jgi:hypothetical protein
MRARWILSQGKGGVSWPPGGLEGCAKAHYALRRWLNNSRRTQSVAPKALATLHGSGSAVGDESSMDSQPT